MSRQRPWRAVYPGAVIVDRSTRWGNPITFSEVGAKYPSLDDRQVATLIVRHFEVLARQGVLSYPNWRFLGGERGPVEWRYPSLDEIRGALGGRDLACWCALDMPCHADVLLELANDEQPPAAEVWRVMHEQNVSRNQAAHVADASLRIRDHINERRSS